MPLPISLEESLQEARRDRDGARLDLIAWEVSTFGGDWRAEALSLVDDLRAQLRPKGSRRKALVFTGHRLDSPGRGEARFPPRAEGLAREMIREAVRRHYGDGADTIGIAGGASGGDLLFHEVCAEVGVETELLLVAPADAYEEASVADSGDRWIQSFRELVSRRSVKVLQTDMSLPGWLAERDDYSIWQRNNVWTLACGFAESPRVTVLALWDGKQGDGPGGTADMLAHARSRGAEIDVLDARALASAEGAR